MMGILSIYQHILVTMALFIFIVNQANILYDTFHIAFIRHRVIKKMKSQVIDEIPQDRFNYPCPQEKPNTSKSVIEWKWPTWCYTFNWWTIPLVIIALVISSMASYIFFGYDPSPPK